MSRAALVFVHGLFSSSRSWADVQALIQSDQKFSDLSLLNFEYFTPRFSLNPFRRIPDFDLLAESFGTFLDTAAADFADLVIVTHSQGGLIVQRYLCHALEAGRGHKLSRIRAVIMFACPNSGSELLILARRGLGRLWRHPQERQLRPLSNAVSHTQQVVIERVVYSSSVLPHACPIRIVAYAGESDNIVTVASAKGMFPDTGVLPGDHFSIIRPTSIQHRAYIALRYQIIAALEQTTLSRRPGDGNSLVRIDASSGQIEFTVPSEVAVQMLRGIQRGIDSAEVTSNEPGKQSLADVAVLLARMLENRGDHPSKAD